MNERKTTGVIGTTTLAICRGLPSAGPEIKHMRHYNAAIYESNHALYLYSLKER